MGTRFGGPGVVPTLGNLASNKTALQAGEVFRPPANWYRIITGRYTVVQSYDFISTTWRTLSLANDNEFWYCDGVNTRIANTSGCAIGALLTNGGSGYLSPPAVTPSAGNSVWTAIVGGAVNTAVTVGYGGNNYTQPPIVVFSAPPSPGVQAMGYATIAGGLVTGVVVTDQGAGYTYPPTISFTNDPRDQTGANASAVATLTGAGTVTAVVCNDHGNPVAAVPTLTFSGGSGAGAAATAIMNFAITGYAVTTAGAGYTAAVGGVTGTATPVPVAGVPAYLNPAQQVGLLTMRPAVVSIPTSAAGALLVGGTVIDGGAYETIPSAGQINIIAGAGLITTAAVITYTVGGIQDSVYLNPQ
jgi:hypothetical protein